MSDTLVRSVKKAMEALDILAFEDTERNGIGLFDLARKLDQKPNTLRNILKTLIACGYVSQNEKSLYVVGNKITDMLHLNQFSGNSILIESIKPLLQELGRRINESVVLTTLVNGNRIPIIRIEDNNLIKVDASLEEMRHIYERPTGRILVAFADDDHFKQIKSKWGYPGEKWDGVLDDKSFEKTREQVRAKGYVSMLNDDSTLISFAVPVKDYFGTVRYALGSYVPTFRCSKEKQSIILKELQNTAKSIEKLVIRTK